MTPLSSQQDQLDRLNASREEMQESIALLKDFQRRVEKLHWAIFITALGNLFLVAATAVTIILKKALP